MSDSPRVSWAERRKLRAEYREMGRRLRRAQPHVYAGLLYLTMAIRNRPDWEPEDLARCVEANTFVASALALITTDGRSLRKFIGLRPRWHYSNLERDMVPPIGARFLLDLICQRPIGR
jgi:hypothetical protein